MISQTASSTSPVWAILRPQTPGTQYISFPTKEHGPNEFQFYNLWKIYQSADGSVTKIINWSASFLKVNNELLEMNEERSLVSQDKIMFVKDGKETSEYEFLLIKMEPRNELKRDRDYEFLLQNPRDLEKQVKVEDDTLIEQNVYKFSENQMSEPCLNGKKPLENVPQTIWKSGNKRGEKKPPKRIIFGAEICSQNTQQQQQPKISFSNGDVYEGELRDGLMHGKGLLKFNNGDIFKGNWRNNKREGKGILTLKNGLPFEGIWINDVIQPQVTIYYDKDGRYDGEINSETLLREGKGFLKINNGDLYEGEFVNEHFEGQGIYTWKDKDVYNGEWKNGIRDGWGVMKYSNGNTFECNWKKDKREGKGKIIQENGDIIEGKWVKDVLQMPVTIQYVNGDKYEGEVGKKSLKRQGKGVLTFQNGDIYDGSWKNDKKEGEGILRSGDKKNITEEGQWKNDERFGPGK